MSKAVVNTTKSDQIHGPHNQLQVVMARGLFSYWKQPIYFHLRLDQKKTKHKLSLKSIL